MAQVRETVAFAKPDAIVVAGDMTSHSRMGAHLVIQRLNALGVPLLAVRGNSDPACVEDLLDAGTHTRSLHFKKISINGVQFAGISGTVPVPFASRLAWDEARAMEKLAALVQEDTVLVAHSPPRGIQDQVLGRFHVGSRGLRELVAARRPALVLCGHVHGKTGVCVMEKTLVVNCSVGTGGGGAVIDMVEGRPPEITML